MKRAAASGLPNEEQRNFRYPRQTLPSTPIPYPPAEALQSQLREDDASIPGTFRNIPRREASRPDILPESASGGPFDAPGMQPARMTETYPYGGVVAFTGASAVLTDEGRSSRAPYFNKDYAAATSNVNAGAKLNIKNNPSFELSGLEASSSLKEVGGNNKKDKKKASVRRKARKKFFWPHDLHRSFVAAIFDVGLTHASIASLTEILGQDEELTKNRVKTQLERYRSIRKSVRSGGVATAKPKGNVARLPPRISNAMTARSQSTAGTSPDVSKQSTAADGTTTSATSSSAATAASVAASSNNNFLTTSQYAAAASHKSNSDNESTEDDGKEAADPSLNYFEFPRFTEQERQSPYVEFLSYLVGVLQMLTKELEEERAAKATAAGPNAIHGDGKAAVISLGGNEYGDRHNPGPSLGLPLSTNTNGATTTATPISSVAGRPKEDSAATCEDAKQRPFDVFESNDLASSPPALGFTVQHQRPRRKFFPDDEDSVSPRSSAGTDSDSGSGDHHYPDPSLHSNHQQQHPTLPRHVHHHSRQKTELNQEGIDEDPLFCSIDAYCAHTFSNPSPNNRTE